MAISWSSADTRGLHWNKTQKGWFVFWKGINYFIWRTLGTLLKVLKLALKSLTAYSRSCILACSTGSTLKKQHTNNFHLEAMLISMISFIQPFSPPLLKRNVCIYITLRKSDLIDIAYLKMKCYKV